MQWKAVDDCSLRLFHAEECGFAGASVNPGDYACEETHVPIPNTTVKLTGPMIVPTSAKVGYCREHFKSPVLGRGFFVRACLWQHVLGKELTAA